jgi:hypothetical protein
MRRFWKDMGKAACRAGWLLSDVPYPCILKHWNPAKPYKTGSLVAAWRDGYMKALRAGKFNSWKVN